MKPNLKQANARIKEIMQQEGLTFREAQKRYWETYSSNIGVKAARLRAAKQKEIEKQQRATERQTRAAQKRKCGNITGTTDDGYKISVRVTDVRRRKS